MLEKNPNDLNESSNKILIGYPYDTLSRNKSCHKDIWHMPSLESLDNYSQEGLGDNCYSLNKLIIRQLENDGFNSSIIVGSPNFDTENYHNIDPSEGHWNSAVIVEVNRQAYLINIGISIPIAIKIPSLKNPTKKIEYNILQSEFTQQAKLTKKKLSITRLNQNQIQLDISKRKKYIFDINTPLTDEEIVTRYGYHLENDPLQFYINWTKEETEGILKMKSYYSSEPFTPEQIYRMNLVPLGIHPQSEKYTKKLMLDFSKHWQKRVNKTI